MGEGGAIECGCLGHFRLSLKFRLLDRNILRKGVSYIFAWMRVCMWWGVARYV